MRKKDVKVAHLNPHLELFGQVLHQLPKINSPISRVIKNPLFGPEDFSGTLGKNTDDIRHIPNP